MSFADAKLNRSRSIPTLVREPEIRRMSTEPSNLILLFTGFWLPQRLSAADKAVEKHSGVLAAKVINLFGYSHYETLIGEFDLDRPGL